MTRHHQAGRDAASALPEMLDDVLDAFREWETEGDAEQGAAEVCDWLDEQGLTPPDDEDDASEFWSGVWEVCFERWGHTCDDDCRSNGCHGGY